METSIYIGLFIHRDSNSSEYHSRMWQPEKITQTFEKLFIAILIAFGISFGSEVFASVSDLESIDKTASLTGCYVLLSKEINNIQIGSDNLIDLYLITNSEKIVSLNKINFDINWQTNFGGQIVSNLVVGDNSIFFINKIESNSDSVEKRVVLRSIDKLTGLTNWQDELKLNYDEKETETKFYVFSFQENIVAVFRDGTIQAFSKNDGKTQWTVQTRKTIPSLPVIKEDLLIFGDDSNKVVLFSITKQSIIKEISSNLHASLLESDPSTNNIIIGDRKGSIKIFNTQNDKVLGNFRAGAAISSIKVLKQGILISSQDNFVYLISEKNGDLIWKKRLNGRVSGDPLVFQESLFVNSIESSEILILKTDSGKLFSKIILPIDDFILEKGLIVDDTIFYATRLGLYKISTTTAGCMKK